jgi:uncharacterized protein YndB with AHSA1/START domain
MAHAYASIIVDAPVEAVWAIVRDFSALPSWVEGIGACSIEDGRAPDSVGCIRAFVVGGNPVRERLLSLDDSRYTFSYNFETPAFPVKNYVALFEAIPVTNGERTFVQWQATFDEAPEDAGKYVDIVSNGVFAAGLASLAKIAAGKPAPEGAVRWQDLRPAKVYCASVIAAPLEKVWETVRDFAGMGAWHEDVRDMHMLAGARGDQVSGVRDFSMNGGHLLERLTFLSDTEHAFRYKIDESGFPWLNYHAGARFYPVSADATTFAVWTADWVAAPHDDAALIPGIHTNVFQKAFDTLDRLLR